MRSLWQICPSNDIERFVPYGNPLPDHEEHSDVCRSTTHTKRLVSSQRHRRWWHRYLLQCRQHLDSVANKTNKAQRLKVITSLSMWRSHDMLKRKVKSLSLFLGKVVSNSLVVSLMLLLLVGMLLNHLMVGIVSAGDEKKVRQAETLTKEFWTPIFEGTDFAEFIKSQYSIGLAQKVDMDEIDIHRLEKR